MVSILSPSGLEDPAGGEAHSRAMVSRNWNRINDNWKPLEGPVSLNLNTGWATRSGGFAPPSIYKIGEHIHLRGSIMNSALASWTAGTQYIVATIPDAKYYVPAGKAVEFRIKFRASIANPFTLYEGILLVSGADLRWYPSASISNMAAETGNMSFDGFSWLSV